MQSDTEYRGSGGTGQGHSCETGCSCGEKINLDDPCGIAGLSDASSPVAPAGSSGEDGPAYLIGSGRSVGCTGSVRGGTGNDFHATVPVDERIVRFIGRHHVLTLATTVDDVPHCSSLFYAYLPEQNLFAVTSAGNTWHVAQLQRNARVAAAVVLETKLARQSAGIASEGPDVPSLRQGTCGS